MRKSKFIPAHKGGEKVTYVGYTMTLHFVRGRWCRDTDAGEKQKRKLESLAIWSTTNT